MPALLERPKMTRVMYQGLKRHIMKEREKKKQEREQDALMERLKKEKETRKKKEEEDSLTLEQTKEQVANLEKKLETTKQEKHDLFSSLKRVLHQEDETRRKAQQREQNELLSLQPAYASTSIGAHHPGLMQQVISGRPTLYKPTTTQIIPTQTAGVKRNRSPTPPPTSAYQAFSDQKFTYPPVKQQAYSIGDHNKPTAYPASNPSAHVFVTQAPASGYATSQSSTSTKYNSTGQSAFTSYPSHFAAHQQQKQITETPFAPGYTLQRLQQPGYLQAAKHPPAISLQQLERANQQSGFNDENYKQLQQQQHIRGLAPIAGQQATILPQAIQLQQATQSKGSIVTGYVPRNPTPSQQPSAPFQPPTTQVGASYQPTTSQATYAGQQAAGRPTYGGQPPRPFMFG